MTEHKFKIGQLVYFYPKGARRAQLDAAPGAYLITKRLPAAKDGEFQCEIEAQSKTTIEWQEKTS